MPFNDVENLLPNGFHDAFLRGLSVDYVRRTADMELEVWVGDLETQDRSVREAYRQGRLHLSGVLFLSVDIPNQEFFPPDSIGISVDVALTSYSDFPKSGWPEEPLPEGATVRTFYFTDTADSFLHIAFLDVTWTWQSEPRTIY